MNPTKLISFHYFLIFFSWKFFSWKKSPRTLFIRREDLWVLFALFPFFPLWTVQQILSTYYLKQQHEPPFPTNTWQIQYCCNATTRQSLWKVFVSWFVFSLHFTILEVGKWLQIMIQNSRNCQEPSTNWQLTVGAIILGFS